MAPRERAQQPSGGVALAERPRSAAPRSPSPVAQSALRLQGSAGNGAVARLAAQGGATAVLAPGAAAPVAEAVPTGPIPEMVPAASAREAREAAPERRSWWDRVKSAVSDVLSSIGAGLGSLTSRVLGTVAGWARRIPGYGLLTVALGKDVVTGQAVPRTATNVIGGLVGLVPGGAELFRNLQESRAIERAAAWFGTAWGQLGLTWEYLRGLFQRAWDSLGVRDLLNPSGAWERIQAIFAPPLQRVLAFARAAGAKLLELVFEGALAMAGPLGTQVMGIIRRAGSVLGTIFRDPIGFAGKLVAAVRGGLGRFASRIGHHLQQGLFGWLTGALRGAVTLPERFDLRGILSLVLQLFGATWTWLRTKMVRLLGEDRVAMIERAVDWVQRIATEGLSAVWERIAEFATGLVDTVLDSIKEWVGRSVVGAAISKLVTMFNPAGAIIQAVIAAYNTVKFFIERAQQLGALAEAVFSSIGAIASGALGPAMTAVENALSRALPVAIGFLARLIGLGDVATPVKNLIERARGVIDRALDKVVESVKGLAGRLLGRGKKGGDAKKDGGPDARTPAEKAQAVDDALAATAKLTEKPDWTKDGIVAALPALKARHRVRTLTVQEVDEELVADAANSPGKTLKIGVVSRALSKAITASGGVVGFLKKIVSDGRAGSLTWPRFLVIWQKHPSGRSEVKAQFRKALKQEQYAHEWIPTDQIAKVMEIAITQAEPNRSKIDSALKWLDAHNLLRSPTRAVIWRFELRKDAGSKTGFAIDADAHTGSFVHKQKKIVKGREYWRSRWISDSGPFHDTLRAMLNKHKSGKPGDLAEALRDFAEKKVWKGDGIPVEAADIPIGEFGAAHYMDDSDPRPDVTLGEIAKNQAKNYSAMMQMFAEAIKKLK